MIFDQFLTDLVRRKENLKDEDKWERYAWSIISAMRGPDFTIPSGPRVEKGLGNSEELKWLTTARIRHVVFGRRQLTKMSENYENYEPLTLDVNGTPLDKAQRDRRDKYLDNVNYHYANHIIEAYQAIWALYDYDLWVEEVVLDSLRVEHKEV